MILSLSAPQSKAKDYPELDPEQLSWLGSQIYNNECSRRASCLTSWNEGEEFPSLGLGHFIWYQSGQQEIFEESFPLLLQYLQNNAVELPAWIIDVDFNSPWSNRNIFMEEFDGMEMTELRKFLEQQISLQVQFIVARFERSLSQMIMESPEAEGAIITQRFLQIANTSPPFGLYALIDYVNFKGEGISSKEQYSGQGWGLKQVLENMNGDLAEPLQAFVKSAQETLQTRVNNSPPDRNEQRWLPGWFNRLNTYLPTIQE